MFVGIHLIPLPVMMLQLIIAHIHIKQFERNIFFKMYNKKKEVKYISSIINV